MPPFLRGNSPSEDRLVFADRADAGRRLAASLVHLADRWSIDGPAQAPVVLGLPRGGVLVAAEVARILAAPLDVIVVRKLGVPYQPEVAMGAIGEGGVRVISRRVMRQAGVGAAELQEVERRERAELERRARIYRIGHPRLPLDGRRVIVVDDGVATGSTARAACAVVRAGGARLLVLAVPVGPPHWHERLAGAADEYVWLETPDPFSGVSRSYHHFGQTSDDEVIEALTPGNR